MSLVRIALRISAVRALFGNTDVGDQVRDSQIGAVDVTADGTLQVNEGKPFVTVYTDAAKAGSGDDASASGPLELRSMRINGLTEIIFEAGITAAMVATNPDTDESEIVGIGAPATDAGFELQLDLIVRQIGDALSDPDNLWAEVFRSFCSRFVSIERARVSSAEGQRQAAHQLKITADLLADPVRGEALRPTSAFAKFLALADGIDDPDLQASVAAIRATMEGENTELQTVRRRFGLTENEADAMLLAPADGAPEGGSLSPVEVASAPAAP